MIRTPSPPPDIYPDAPGFKVADGASQEAAAAIAPGVPRVGVWTLGARIGSGNCRSGSLMSRFVIPTPNAV
jgi:hypothetical protein